jgi:cytochrome d ubiquinol oxidase subunit I
MGRRDQGLKAFPKADRPNSTIVFWTFRIMAGLGVLMALLAIVGFVLRRRGRLYDSASYHRFALAMGPTGFISLLAGWITTEVGRQPWVIYGVMHTTDALSPVPAQQVGITLLAFVVVYALVFGTGIYYLLRLAKHGPAVLSEDRPSGTPVPVRIGNAPEPADRVVANTLARRRIS